MSAACRRYIRDMSLMPQFVHMGGKLILQGFILIGGYVAMWALLIGDTCMARLSKESEMQGNAIARVAIEVR